MCQTSYLVCRTPYFSVSKKLETVKTQLLCGFSRTSRDSFESESESRISWDVCLILQKVADVLIFGFQALVPTISDSLLRSYPQLCDRYFSFVAFVYNSYPDRLSAHLAAASPEVGNSFLGTLVEHLLWASGAIEPTAARLALQAIQIMASNQLQLLQKSNIWKSTSNHTH